jgi:hypothetical protein
MDKNCQVASGSTMVQDTQPEQAPFSQREWAQTPLAVQEFVLALVTRVQELAVCRSENGIGPVEHQIGPFSSES